MRAALSNPRCTRLLSRGPALSHRGGPSGAPRMYVYGASLIYPVTFSGTPRWDRMGGIYLSLWWFYYRVATIILRRGVRNVFCSFESVIRMEDILCTIVGSKYPIVIESFFIKFLIYFIVWTRIINAIKEVTWMTSKKNAKIFLAGILSSLDNSCKWQY